MSANLLPILIGVTDPAERSAYAAGLVAAGYNVQQVASGLRCVTRLRRRSYSLLVVDSHLLWGGGDGVIELMIDDESITVIPAVLIDIPPVVFFGTTLPRLAKPIAVGELVQVVKSRLNHRQWNDRKNIRDNLT
ncbi:MAG: hypothetical protein AAGG48_17330 [Planctomycetota bacterium]